MTSRQTLSTEARRLAAIVASSDDAIVGKDLNGIVFSWNPGAEGLFGYTAAEMIGQPITRLIPPERQADEVRILDRIRRGERVEPFDTQRRTKDGSSRTRSSGRTARSGWSNGEIVSETTPAVSWAR